MRNNSIITSKYEGWIASIFFHGLLSLIFVLIIYDNPIDISEYVDVTFSNYSPIDLLVIEENVLSPAPPTPEVVATPPTAQPVIALSPRISQPIAKSIIPIRNVDLPTRRMTEYDENRIPIESQGQLNKSGQINRINTKRETIYGVNDNLSSLDDEIFNVVKPGSKPSDRSVGKNVDAIAIPGQKGGDVKFEKPWDDIDWGKSVERYLLYGNYPEYPDGINIEGMVKIQITVLPSGTIGNMFILQKLDATLESVATKTMKLWRFNPLDDQSSHQTATIIYNFKLE